ncbi:hypothetical protein [Chamaesiphon polymorphus]|uniref:hypothetical protein n=1 Tax=Chamaesiphon polymorphus TaxID=2107691 RepID=UPI0015E6D7DD|nr:hypothetical protein [Chamaesiphon polymorphus]
MFDSNEDRSITTTARLEIVVYVDFALQHSSHYRLIFGAYGATSARQNHELT